MIGEPDAGKPHVRFDEGAQETCDIATRLRPILRSPQFNKAFFRIPLFIDSAPAPACDPATRS